MFIGHLSQETVVGFNQLISLLAVVLVLCFGLRLRLEIPEYCIIVYVTHELI